MGRRLATTRAAVAFGATLALLVTGPAVDLLVALLVDLLVVVLSAVDVLLAGAYAD